MKEPDGQDRATEKPVAVIDIGSNSVRLVVFEGARRNPVSLFNEKVHCGLGRSLASTGSLDAEGVERALRALRRFRAISSQLGVARCEVIATAAAREADNGPDFVARASQVLKCDISVISGKEEAHLAAAGVISGTPDAAGMAGDLGGGSLEIIGLNKKKGASGGVTLPLGGLRLIDLSGGNLERARKIVDAELERVDWLKKGKGLPFYAVGGTWRAFARLHMAQIHYPLSVIHGYRIPIEEALTFARVLDHLSPSSLERVVAISSARRETLPYGALVLERLIKRMGPSEFIVSGFGVREGLLYTTLTKEEKKRDPLLAACDELARLRSRSSAHAWELCKWTDPLFKTPGLTETPEEKRLRYAACLISDIGWRTHPDYRSAQTLAMIAQASFAGLDHPGRAFLALSVYYRNRGLVSAESSPGIHKLIDQNTLSRARIIGAAVRAAHMISAGMPGIIGKTPLSHDGGRLVLSLPKKFAVLEGERLDSRFGILARELGLQPEIRIGGKESVSASA
ncbi:guanosine-5'-triphosphate,3'-diphosphate pyrophosphatase [bacterium BMS3Bbin10]|nr:guanosine-5'-triphosphate,3'-diphosphate pyrophosphatase [bacterium BMS3Bbin10]